MTATKTSATRTSATNTFAKATLSPKFLLTLSGLAVATMLSGCAGGAHLASAGAATSRAQAALYKGNSRAVPLAEAAVAASPRDAAARAVLGSAYLKVGRFQSAATAFNDAMELGDNSPRTALSLALTQIGSGKGHEAVAILDDWRDSIPASDLGLALALAGETSRGVAILADALRGGDNSPKMRQNLAYAYALDGRWREARLMMAQDVPADQVSDRIGEWAMSSASDNFQQRVAVLLSVPVRADSGQPTALALAHKPATEQMATESDALKPPPVLAKADAELPAAGEAPAPPAPAVSLASYVPVRPDSIAAPVAEMDTTDPVAAHVAPSPAAPAAIAVHEAPAAFAQAFAARPGRKSTTVAHNSSPVTHSRAAVAAPVANGSHLVQLGSFASAQGARRAWGIFTVRNQELRRYKMTITPAVVRGQNFWRVAAGGFSAGSANGLCSSVKNRGGVCFAYAGSVKAVPGVAPRGAAGPTLARR